MAERDPLVARFGNTQGRLVPVNFVPLLETRVDEPFVLADAQTLTLKADDGGLQTITFSTGDFLDITQATAQEVVDALNAQLEDATAYLTSLNRRVSIRAEQSIEITGGTANPGLDFNTTKVEVQVFTLGSDYYDRVRLQIGDYIDLYQDLDVTGINLIRFRTELRQPDTPTTREIAEDEFSAKVAILKRGEVQSSAPGQVINGNNAPYALADGQLLDIFVDGSMVMESAMFVTGDFSDIGNATAAEVVAVMNLQFFSAEAEVFDFDKIRLKSKTTGTSSSIRVNGGTANPELQFDTVLHQGGDDVSAIVIPGFHFEDKDLGVPLVLTGCLSNPDPLNTRVIARLDTNADGEYETGILYDQINAEAAGFSAQLQGCKWKGSVWIDTLPMEEIQPNRSSEYISNNVAVNVSKLTGTHRLSFRMELIAAS